MKKLLTFFLSFLLVVSALIGYGYSKLCPMAAPLAYPEAAQTADITVTKSQAAEAVAMSQEDVSILLGAIASAMPTRKQSVNDAPYATPYYRIAILTEERTYVYYVYEERGVTYLESPYEGIYRIDDAVLKRLTLYFEKEI